MVKFPFEVSFEEVQDNLDVYVDAVFSCLTSEFLVMPKGKGFIEFAVFEDGYESLKRATAGFHEVTPETLVSAVYDTPIALVVLRCMIGFTPSEWAYYASRQTGITVTQSAARTIDRNIRMDPQAPLPKSGTVQGQRIGALISAACHALASGIPRQAAADTLHRLDKADTRAGLVSVRASANLGVPYSVLLYERFLGRPLPGIATPSANWLATWLRTPLRPY